jgi:chorismate synthase
MSRFETRRGAIEIRELSRISEMLAAEAIQLQIWGPEIIAHPKEILIPIQHEGGLLAGAFAPSGEMVGLIFGFPTRDPGALHSQMLGTLEVWRGLGIGARLKWFQRDWCLKQGITQVRWTVDPLRAANAELNIRHLGGSAATYLPDYYGRMQGIDAGAPTDRLLVDWRLDSPRVAEHARQAPADRGFPQAEAANAVELEAGPDGSRRACPVRPRFDLSGPQILLHLPENFMQLAKSEPELALRWRMHTRELLTHYFSNGYAISGFTRLGGPAYLLEKA